MMSLTRQEGQGIEQMTSGGAADNHWDEDTEQAEYDWRQIPLIPDLGHGKGTQDKISGHERDTLFSKSRFW